MKLQQNKRWSYDRFTDKFGQVWKIHKSVVCTGEYCPFHNPSDHLLKDAEIIMRGTNPMDAFGTKPYGFVERICEHGIGHSDPDSVAFFAKQGSHGLGIHACDGCCNGRYKELQNG